MRAKIIYLFVSLICASGVLYGQHKKENTDTLSTNAPKGHLTISLEYLSDNVYLGRKDSVAIPYITPTVKYFFKSGIFFNGSFSYLTPENRIDMASIGAGYAFSKKKWEGEIVADKFFYNSDSYSVKSEQQGDVSATLGYNFGFINPRVEAFINFGSKNDYGTSFSLEHEFSFSDEKADITPSFVVNASTQNYYASYYSKRKYVKTKKGKKVTYAATANTYDASKFKLLDYEFSAPFNYTLNRFTLSFTPTVAVPVNPSVVTLTLTPVTGAPITKTFTESIGTTFFWSIGISYRPAK